MQCTCMYGQFVLCVLHTMDVMCALCVATVMYVMYNINAKCVCMRLCRCVVYVCMVQVYGRTYVKCISVCIVCIVCDM